MEACDTIILKVQLDENGTQTGRTNETNNGLDNGTLTERSNKTTNAPDNGKQTERSNEKN